MVHDHRRHYRRRPDHGGLTVSSKYRSQLADVQQTAMLEGGAPKRTWLGPDAWRMPRGFRPAQPMRPLTGRDGVEKLIALLPLRRFVGIGVRPVLGSSSIDRGAREGFLRARSVGPRCSNSRLDRQAAPERQWPFLRARACWLGAPLRTWRKHHEGPYFCSRFESCRCVHGADTRRW